MPLPGMCIAGMMAGETTTAKSAELIHTSSSASETVDYGADVDGRWIVVLALGGDNVSSYNLAATLSGSAGAVIVRHSSGDGGGTATGSAIIVGQPSGTSGTVSVTGISGTRRFYVLRVTGYDLSSAVFSDDSAGGGIPPWSANVSANGLTIAIAQNSNTNDITWTGLTERVEPNALITGKNSTVAWDVNMAADASHDVDFTASDVDGVTSGCIATFAPA